MSAKGFPQFQETLKNLQKSTQEVREQLKKTPVTKVALDICGETMKQLTKDLTNALNSFSTGGSPKRSEALGLISLSVTALRAALLSAKKELASYPTKYADNSEQIVTDMIDNAKAQMKATQGTAEPTKEAIQKKIKELFFSDQMEQKSPLAYKALLDLVTAAVNKLP